MARFEPRRPHGPRDPNDGWATGPRGRFWGRGGAAGLLAHDPTRGILLQHRVAWSDQGGTWGLPGGARHVGESAIDGALREAREEAGVPDGGMSLRFTFTFDVGYWSYTTVAVNVDEPFEAQITDPESVELRWVALDEVDDLPLHPGFGNAWPSMHQRLLRPTVLVVDAANVIGSRPDGWWHDRSGAAEQLLGRLTGLLDVGVPGHWFGSDDSWRLWPTLSVVLEGQAKQATIPGETTISVVRAERDGDSAIVDHVARLGEQDVAVVTADRDLRARVQRHGARTIGPATLHGALEDQPGRSGDEDR